MQALRSLSDSGDKLEYYIDALLSFVKEKNLEILKEMPTLQKRSQKSLDKLRNASKSQVCIDRNFVLNKDVVLLESGAAVSGILISMKRNVTVLLIKIISS